MVKIILKYLCITCNLFLLQACANILPSSITISTIKMQQKLQEQFPKQKNVLSIYQVNITNPKLSLDKENKRVRIIVDTEISSPFMQSLQGNVKFSSSLMLDETKQNLLLKEPLVEEVYFKNINSETNNIIAPIFKVAASTLLDKFKIYHIKTEDLIFLGVKVQPTEITILDNGIKVGIDTISTENKVNNKTQ